MISTQVVLKSYPNTVMEKHHFEITRKTLPELKQGQVLVKNKWMTVDPALRIRMNPLDHYLTPFQLGETLSAPSIGVIEYSNNPTKFPKGTLVLSQQGWRDYFISDCSDLKKIEPMDNPYLHLSLLGNSSLTGYIGIEKFSTITPGDCVFVSGASGSVGSTVCQLAKMKGAYVVGSAGSDAKLKWLSEVAKVDMVINYKKHNMNDYLSNNLKQGIDLYFDNVGGDQLIAAMKNMNRFGRIIMCGMISQYNKTAPTINIDLFPVITKHLSILGYTRADHMDMHDTFIQNMMNWHQNKKIISQESFINGLENSPQAFIDMLSGKHMGKVIISI